MRLYRFRASLGERLASNSTRRSKNPASSNTVHEVLLNARTYRLSLQKPLASPVTLGSGDSIRVSLTALEEKKARRPHQAFVSLSETTAGLEESFPLGLKESGKGTISIVR